MLLLAAWKYALPVWWIAGWTFLYLHLLALGAIFIRWNFYLLSHSRGSESRQLALSFDDGPGVHTDAILNVLKQQEVRAAFFTIGKNAAAHPDTVRRWHQEGHLIGNHSYDHGFHFDWKSAKAMRREIEQTNQVIHSITGLQPRMFRPPYGVTNPALAKAVRRSGMHSIGWSVRSFDTTAKTGAALLVRILQRIKGGDIILLHDTMPLTSEILMELIITARKMGYSFVRIDELLETEAYA